MAWDFILEYWIEVLFGLVAIGMGAMWKYFRKYIKKEHSDAVAVEDGVRALLRSELFEKCDNAVNKGWISYSELSNIEYVYDAYHRLGGNGTGTTAFEEAKKLPKYDKEKHK